MASLLLLAGSAHAQVDMAASLKAEAHAQAADEARREGDFAEALRRLQAAARIDPQGKYFSKIGTLYRDQDQPEQALAAYKKALELGNLRSPGKLKAWIEKLERQLGGVLVAIASNPPGAEIFLDEVKQPAMTTPARLELKPGAHIITLKLAGRQEASRAITVEAGKEGAYSFDLAVAPAGEPAATEPASQAPEATTREPAPAPKEGKGLAWALLGTGAAGLVGGGVLTMLAFSAQSDVDAAVAETKIEQDGMQRIRGAEDDRDALFLYSYIAYGVGAAAGLAGTWMLLGGEGQPAATAVITPGGLVISGAF